MPRDFDEKLSHGSKIVGIAFGSERSRLLIYDRIAISLLPAWCCNESIAEGLFSWMEDCM